MQNVLFSVFPDGGEGGGGCNFTYQSLVAYRQSL